MKVVSFIRKSLKEVLCNTSFSFNIKRGIFMFYVSSKQESGLYGVTDTKDNIEEIYSEKRL